VRHQGKGVIGMVNRRETLGWLGASAVSLAVSPSAFAGAPQTDLLPADCRWITHLTDGMLVDQVDTLPMVEGVLPPELTGTLYRNGPALFERNGYRKSTILDGDGMIRAFTFSNGNVRFRTRFVATEKFTREASANRFLYPTWTTPAPGLFDNFPAIPAKSQAGITAVVKSGVLYAFDEVGHPYALDPDTLSTLHQLDPRGANAQGSPRAYKAHTKTDGITGAWVLAGTSGRRQQQLHAVVVDAKGRPQAQCQTPNPRGDYFHDFFWTGRHVVFHLHPTPLSPIPMLMGFRTYVDCLSWRPDLGSLLLVVDPSGSEAPITMEVPASWMWHTVNAYERDNTIIADFVGYDAPDHFFGPRAALRTVMTGRAGIADSPGKLRRAVLDLNRRSARVETLIGEHFEFPTISPHVQGHRYAYGYCAIGDIRRSWFHDGVAKIEVESGKFQQFRFGPQYNVGEPVFVPHPKSRAEDAGWLLCEVLDGLRGVSDLAVFDAQAVSAGPVARVKLDRPLPFSFHGWWQSAAI
jgi:all-trans-8'-apo-beta-carotenal 15,15'-oxygenase